MTGETIDAKRAYGARLIEELHDAESFDAAVSDMEETLAEKPTYVQGWPNGRSILPVQ